MNLAQRIALATGTSPESVAGMTSAFGRATTEFRELKDRVYQSLVTNLGKQLYSKKMSRELLRREIYLVLQQILAHEDFGLSELGRARLVQDLVDEIVGLGPLESFLRDPDVTEIMVNGPNAIFIEKNGLLERTSTTLLDESHLRQIIDRIVSQIGRRVDESSPMVDARLPDGSRINAVIPPIAIDGSTLTIRKFSGRITDKHDLMQYGSISPAGFNFLEAATIGKRNIVISGGTGSGKTTTLNILASAVPEQERIVTIEDSAEIKLTQEHVIRMESRPPNIEGVGQVTIRDLVRNALRMRPDRIVVGEVRDAATLDMLQAMNTGHDGSLTTVHANSARDALSRIETMSLMSDLQLPVKVIREQIVGAVDLIVHQSRFRDGSRKITSIVEISGIEDGTIQTQEIFRFDADASSKVGSGALVPTGIVPRCVDSIQVRGGTVDLSWFKV